MTIPYLPAEEVRVRVRDGRYFIDSRELIRCGIQHRLQDGDVLTVGKQTFEVRGYIYKCREYWVCPYDISGNGVETLGG